MNELELLDQLQTIRNKLNKGEKLTDDEYKVLSAILFGVAIVTFKNTVDLLLKLGIVKGGDNHEWFKVKY